MGGKKKSIDNSAPIRRSSRLTKLKNDVIQQEEVKGKEPEKPSIEPQNETPMEVEASNSDDQNYSPKKITKKKRAAKVNPRKSKISEKEHFINLVDDENDEEDEVSPKKVPKLSVDNSGISTSSIKKTKPLRTPEIKKIKEPNAPVPKKSPKKYISPKKHEITAKTSNVEDGDSESDWEEVEVDEVPGHSQINKIDNKSIEIIIAKKKSKQQEYIETEMRRGIQRFRQTNSLNVHKAQLLLYITHGRKMSEICNDTLLRSIALSVTPTGFISLSSFDTDEKSSMMKFVKWFASAFPAVNKQQDTEFIKDEIVDHFTIVMEKKSVRCQRDRIAILVCILRAIGFDARFVMSVQPKGVKMIKVVASKKTGKSKSNSREESEEPEKQEKLPECPDYWAEVYIEKEERWIPIDCTLLSVDNTHDIEKGCMKPIQYVLAFDNENTCRDITGKYSSQFLSAKVRKVRAHAQEWIKDTIKNMGGKTRLRERIEDKQIHDHLLSLPIPSTVSDFKNHPLYVLQRDLLKFQAIYPKDMKPLGFIKNDAIFPRESVHTLHCKENWIKDARQIKKNEEPYKIVKARPKFGVPKDEQVERPLPLFGFWQTQQYNPGAVKNGLVPRNDYGNVELFKPCMLPKGADYLQVPGLLAVARELEIDCVAAMVGWEFHSHRSVPVIDGWVVPKNRSKQLMEAYFVAKKVEDEKKREKRSKKALQHWKKLIKGMLLRDSVHKKFKMAPGHVHRKGDHTVKDETLDEPAEGTETSWPQCSRQFQL